MWQTFLGALFLDILILSFILHYGEKADCGIPITKWLTVFFIAQLVLTISTYIEIELTRRAHPYSASYSVISFLVIYTFIIAWYIYGNDLWLSDKNNCDEIEGTKPLAFLFTVVMIYGYI